LLGLVQGDGIAAKALGQLGVAEAYLRTQVEAAIEPSKSDNRGSKIPFSPKAKKALELSLREALRLGHNYIGTEHLMLGTLEVVEDDGEATQLLGVGAGDVRARVTELMPNGATPDLRHSTAARDAMRLARQMAGTSEMSTGHLLVAILTDPASQASKALGAFGVTTESLQTRLAEVPLNETTDAPPRPQVVEIKLGETTTTIGDPELAAALGDLSPEQLRSALRDVLEALEQHPEKGPERSD
jgi:ATP-dependent Clp protease ATP-binding subunit ClpA